MSVPARILIQPGFWSTSGPQVRCSIDASHDAALLAHLMHGRFHRGRTLRTTRLRWEYLRKETTGSPPSPARTRSGPTWPGRCTTCRTGWPTWPAAGCAGRGRGSRHHPPGVSCQVARCLPPQAGTVVANVAWLQHGESNASSTHPRGGPGRDNGPLSLPTVIVFSCRLQSSLSSS
jgi:hypothetical protein